MTRNWQYLLCSKTITLYLLRASGQGAIPKKFLPLATSDLQP